MNRSVQNGKARQCIQLRNNALKWLNMCFSRILRKDEHCQESILPIPAAKHF